MTATDQQHIHRLDIVAPADMDDLVTAELFDEAPFGWEETDLDDGFKRFRLHFEKEEHAARVAGRVRALWSNVSAVVEAVPRRDWALAWREYFNAVTCGEDFIIVAPWMAEEAEQGRVSGHIPIIIEPKTAFGTGHHPTTALCLEVLSSLYRDGAVRAGQRFLDVGTGSGILGIGAARLGLSGLGVDIDPLAIENARENAALNDVAGVFQLAEGSLFALRTVDPSVEWAFEERPENAAGFAHTAETFVARDAVSDLVGEERFDIVLANILAGPLVALAERIAARLAPGGALILSGLLTTQADQVRAAYEPLLGPGQARVSDEWVALFWALPR
ncbi:MAG: 50S ribosomal protein L11 methyltransferase [Oceanidesulfovibrio sp.]